MKRPLKPAVVALVILTFACSNSQASQSQSNHEVAAHAAALSIPLTGRVMDAADVLTTNQEAALSIKLQQLEEVTNHQMVVVTVPTLGHEDVAMFARNLGNRWGIGREAYDDGVLLLVAPNERKVRIAVGYGLESKLPDSLCQQILKERMLPHFRENDLPAGIEAGISALIAQLS